MKPYTAIIASFLLLAGCSGQQSSGAPAAMENAGSSTATTADRSAAAEPAAAKTAASAQPQAASKPEKIVTAYLQALIDKDYDKAQQYLSTNRLDGLMPDALLKKTKEQHFQNSISINEFMISEITEIDGNHKLAKVIVKLTAAGKEQSVSDPVMLTQEGGNWKLDYSLALGKQDIADYDSPDDNISLTELQVVQMANGIRIIGKVRNNFTESQIAFGFANTQPQWVLTTSEGSYTFTDRNGYIKPQEKVNSSFSFDGAKGSPQSLELRGIYPADANGLIKPGAKPLTYTIPLK